MMASSVRAPAFGIGLAVALLSGCGGSQPLIGAPGAMPQGAAQPGVGALQDADGSWMSPDAASQDLLYAGTVRSVTIYSYPQGKLMGKLRGFYFVGSVCADSKGNVFVTNFTVGVYEYAHANKKRLRALKTPGGGQPLGCAVDPTTGDLAVALYQHTSTGRGSLEIYKNARGKPITYQDSAFERYYYCGYDRNGNLFVDGLTYPRTGDFIFGELPKGGSQIKTLMVNQYLGWPGGVQWDGKYVAVTDVTAPAIYQFMIKGSKGTKAGTTPLGGYPIDFYGGTWIEGNTVVAPAGFCGKKRAHPCIAFYPYPAGGKPNKTIPHADFDPPESATVSLAPGR